jgi:hypothetical protein
MSLYNMIHGVNPLAPVLMKMLGAAPGDVPRLRDCYFDGEHIVIYTRTGGGNRDCYDSRETTDSEDYDGPFNDDVRALPGFVRDEDDDYDSTYASFYFEVPQQFHMLLDKLKSMAQKQTQAERWEAALDHIKNASPDDPVVQRMTEAFKPVFEAIEKQATEGDK